MAGKGEFDLRPGAAHNDENTKPLVSLFALSGRSITTVAQMYPEII